MGDLLVEKKDHVVCLTINRPQAMNALDWPTADDLRRALQEFRDDDDAYVAILAGAGERAFCTGVDMKKFDREWPGADQGADWYRRFAHSGTGYMGYTRGTDIFKPTIAAIAGYAIAGGMELSLWCDIRIVAENVKMGFSERQYNVPLGDGGSQRLPRIIGLGRALELIITGRLVQAEEALHIGLANEVVPTDRLMERACELATAIAGFPQGSIRASKESVMRGLGTTLTDGLRIEAGLLNTVIFSHDFMEGRRAFRERRAPQYRQD
ncbi:MAG: enoyl-CoA hydratase/isomerase family protein [Dehalococcoidia bacterium]|nr:enoyl-CoA hydratase/isomerase family protein [Dehalococcoidia bacterium]MDP7240115.1 enoyl-CoA hydratase/isomerase family protein [Dehalococcoidia bacterium]